MKTQITEVAELKKWLQDSGSPKARELVNALSDLEALHISMAGLLATQMLTRGINHENRKSMVRKMPKIWRHAFKVMEGPV